MDVLAITQARMGSTRLPEKIMKTIDGKTLLEIHINRIIKSKEITKLIIATTIEKEDNAIIKLLDNLGVEYYRGSVNDVLDRFYQAAKKHTPQWVVRLTSDCPLIDSVIIDAVIDKAKKEDLDYCSNTLIEAFPDGQDVEVFKFSVLEKAWNEAKLLSEREHVTPFIKKNSSFLGGVIFKSANLNSAENYNKVRLTVDEQNDFKVIEYLINTCGMDNSWMAYTNEYLNSQISALNSTIERNEGYKKSIKSDNI